MLPLFTRTAEMSGSQMSAGKRRRVRAQKSLHRDSFALGAQSASIQLAMAEEAEALSVPSPGQRALLREDVLGDALLAVAVADGVAESSQRAALRSQGQEHWHSLPENVHARQAWHRNQRRPATAAAVDGHAACTRCAGPLLGGLVPCPTCSRQQCHECRLELATVYGERGGVNTVHYRGWVGHQRPAWSACESARSLKAPRWLSEGWPR